MSRSLRQAILKTIRYGRRFGVEYTEREVMERLISDKIFSLKVKSQKSKSQTVENKMKLAIRLAKEIGGRFGDILFIGVTGSVAAGYPPENSDIDLMVVTRKNTLWLTRLLLRFWVWQKGIPHRKYGKPELENEFCFNLWLEEDSLKLPKNRQNLKNAMDLILMKTILNRNNTYEKLVMENDWARFFVANGYERIKSKVKSSPKGTSLWAQKSKESSWLKKIINWTVFWPQWWYMKRKVGRGIIDRKRAFFHPGNK
jgi:predicted nucleotidyltransferase